MLPVTTVLLLSIRRLTKAKILAAERTNPAVYSKLEQKILRKLAHSADGWVFQTEEQREWYGKSIGQATYCIDSQCGK